MKKIIGLVLGLMLMIPAVSAAKPSSGTLSVPDGVYGGSVVSTATYGELPKNTTPAYVLGKCYQNNLLVWGAYYEVVDGGATVGPLAATTWTSGSASCVGELGYFTRNGFGRWVILATDNFEVT